MSEIVNDTENKEIPRATDFFVKTERVIQFLPKKLTVACDYCEHSLWKENSLEGPVCYCTKTNEYTYIHMGGELQTTVLQCQYSNFDKKAIDEIEAKKQEKQ